MQPLELAEFILNTYPDKIITPMKLQKLAYYAKIWTVVAGEPWVNVSFKKWPYGPVNDEIYKAYQTYGSNPIPATTIFPTWNSSQAELLQFILNNYVDYSAFTLSAMTYNEDPWKQTADQNTIPEQSILNYYSKQPFAQNLRKDNVEKLFHVLHSNTWHSFVLDMDKTEAAANATYSSYEKFTKLSTEANDEFKELVQSLFSES